MIKSFIFCLLLGVVTLDTTFAQCRDRAVQCPQFINFCHEQLVADYCPFTCRTCPENVCLLNNGDCNHVCSYNAELNQATCSCFPGFKLLSDEKTCEDINECTEGSNPCAIDGKFCVNNQGSYSCHDASSCENNMPGTMNFYSSARCCQVRNSSCGINADIRTVLDRQLPQLDDISRILGGNDASVSRWPWMAQVIQIEGNKRISCGATLIANKWLVTTATCANNTVDSYTIILGHIRNALFQFVDSSREERRAVKQIIIHPIPNVNNIALLELNKPVQTSDIVFPICLPCGEFPRAGDKCWATGFGTIGGFNIPDFLQEVDLPIVDTQECANAFQGTSAIVNEQNTICAGYELGGRDTCFGDNGGPLMCQRSNSCEWYLLGITAEGQMCGEEGTYGLFTSVLRYEQWIRDNVDNESLTTCSTNFDPCRNEEDIRSGCRDDNNVCSSDRRPECALTCCQRENSRPTIGRGLDLPEPCQDDPLRVEACTLLREQCNTPILATRNFLQTFCRRTCGLCE